MANQWSYPISCFNNNLNMQELRCLSKERFQRLQASSGSSFPYGTRSLWTRVMYEASKGKSPQPHTSENGLVIKHFHSVFQTVISLYEVLWESCFLNPFILVLSIISNSNPGVSS